MRPPFLLNLFIAFLNRPLTKPVYTGPDDGRSVMELMSNGYANDKTASIPRIC